MALKDDLGFGSGLRERERERERKRGSDEGPSGRLLLLLVSRRRLREKLK